MRFGISLKSICATVALILTTGLPGIHAAKALPDSLITEDHVYRYLLTDIPKAEAVMAALRAQKKLPAWELDYLEGDLYYNTGRYYKAMQLYAKVLSDRKARQDNRLQMDLLHRLISCYDVTHNEERKVEYVRRLLRKAGECGDRAMQSVALFNMGKSQYEHGLKAMGYKRMERAAQLMRSTDYEYKYDNLRYHYNTLLTYYERDRMGKEALRTLSRLEQVATASTGKEKEGIDGLDAKERKALLAHRTVVLDMLGRRKEADESYRAFSRLGSPADRDQFIVMPYLFSRHLYGEIFRISRKRLALMQEQGDTVNYHMTTVRRNLAEAYFETGRYKEAALNFKMLAVLRDSIKNREQKSAALELAEAYGSAEKNRIIADQRMHNYILGSIIALVLGGGALVVIRNRRMHRCNVALVQRVRDGLAYKEKMEQAQDQREAYRQRIEALEEELSRNGRQATADMPATPPDPGISPAGGSGGAEQGADERRIENLLHKIRSQRLFLRIGFAQKDAAPLAGIPGYLFGEVFKRYAGESFSSRINRMRMEYAAELLTSHPEYTVDVVAEMCGLQSRQQFHRLFMKFAGVTPVTFKKSAGATAG